MEVENKLKILILEDQPNDSELIENELKKAGFDFVPLRVKTEETFAGALLDFKPDVILSDFSMPKFSGLEAFRIVKKMNLDVPFILITGSLPESASAGGLEIGMDAFIFKDKISELPAVLKTALKKRAKKG